MIFVPINQLTTIMKITFTLIFFLLSEAVFSQLPGLVITGSPESVNGATWIYQNTINGIVYDLQGILLKPIGRGPLPAIIINHGTGGNANGYSRTVAKTMVAWGYVCIATNYTHSGGVPCGSPGQCIASEFGASQNNILRAMKCFDILASLYYVDTNFVLTFGHSRGAFLTTAIVGTHPDRFAGAAHTAGGVSTLPGSTAPDTAIANDITVPYMIHHGNIDSTVNILMDQKLHSILTANSVTNKFIVYEGYGHNEVRFDSTMYRTTKDFFKKYCLGNGGIIPIKFDSNMNDTDFDNSQKFVFDFSSNTKIEIYNILGQKVSAEQEVSKIKIIQSNLPNGIYFLKIYNENKITLRKILKVR